MIFRLKQFMEYKHLTVTQFADLSRINRSSMSQILSGRNKKISDEIIKALHTAWPELNISWLLFNEGSMTTDSNDETKVRPMPVLPGIDEENPVNEYTPSDSSKYATHFASNQEENTTAVYSQAQKTPIHQDITDIPVRKETPQRKVVKIMILYSDNTFEWFSPDQSK